MNKFLFFLLLLFSINNFAMSNIQAEIIKRLYKAQEKSKAFFKKRNKKLSKYSYNGKLLPKKVHFIWVGGHLMQDLWGNILEIANFFKFSGYKINIWTDDIRHLQILRHKESKEWNTNLKKAQKLCRMKIRNIDELREKKPDFFDEKMWREFWRFFDSELHGFYNYSAASDLLRLLVNYLEGGVYLDCDISNSDEYEQISEIIMPYGLMMVKGNGTPFLSIKQHPLLEMMLLKTLLNYLEYEEKNLLDQKRLPPATFPKLDHDKTPYVELSIDLGPGLFSWAKDLIKICNRDIYEEDFLLLEKKEPEGMYYEFGNIILLHEFKRTWDKKSQEWPRSLEI